MLEDDKLSFKHLLESLGIPVVPIIIEIVIEPLAENCKFGVKCIPGIESLVDYCLVFYTVLSISRKQTKSSSTFPVAYSLHLFGAGINKGIRSRKAVNLT